MPSESKSWTALSILAADPRGKIHSVCGRSSGAGPSAFSLKQRQCPYCRCAETLNRHSKLYGNDPLKADACTVRGQRVWCSNRGQRGGCGRSFSLAMADVLPRHTVRAGQLWPWLLELLAGLSAKAAEEKLRLPFALETIYHLGRKLRRNLDRLRTCLCREQQPPASTHTDPLFQTVAHLQSVFAGSACPPAQFQLHFQRAFLG